MDKGDHPEIWLEPDCCADHAGVGRTWCQDDVYDCEDGVEPTHYIRADIMDDKLAEVARIRLDLEVENKNLRAEVERVLAVVDRAAHDRTYDGDLIDDIRDIFSAADTQGRAERPEVHRSGGLPDAPRLADDKQAEQLPFPVCKHGVSLVHLVRCLKCDPADKVRSEK